MKLTAEQASVLRGKLERDTIGFSRFIGFNWANVGYRDENGVLKGKKVSGPEWGISYEVEGHVQMASALDSGASMILILMPRGSLKSTFLTGFAAKEGLRDRDLKIFYGMDVAEKAEGKIEEIRQIYEANKDIRALWGDVRDTPWRKGEFKLSGRQLAGDPNPTFAAGGPNKSPTGRHFDIIILDDLENEDTVKEPEQMEKVKAFYRKMQPVLNPGGRIIVCGTRYADEDLYGWLMKEFAEDFQIVTVDCGMEVEQDENGREYLVGTPTFGHLDEDFLNRQLKSMGLQWFTSQYLNRCLAATRQAFFREHFKTERWERWMEELSVYVITDTATSTDPDACQSVCGILGLDSHDTAYLLDLWFGRALPADYTRVLCDMLERWDQRVRIKKILMENIGLNQVYRPLIEAEWKRRRMRPFVWESINRGGVSALAKDRRIERLHGRFKDGRFVVVDTVPTYIGNDLVFRPNGFRDEETGIMLPDGELVRQFIRWPATQSKDIPDAIADIDHIDGKGARLCTGMGIRQAKRAKALARRRGQRVGRERLPRFAREGDLSVDPFQAFANRLR